MIQFIIIALIRLLVPLTIFRWRFWGVVLSIAADASDVMIMEKFGFGPFTGQVYNGYDKLFDIYNLFIEFLMVLKWSNPLAKRTGAALFAWRMIGAAIYEMTHLRSMLFFAPNIFEYFYLAVAGLEKYVPKFRLDSAKKLIIILLIVGIPNIAKEYYMHYLELNPWIFFKKYLFWWLYN